MSPRAPTPPLVHAARRLRRRLAGLSFGPPVTHVYNPLDYARAAHEQYLTRFGAGPKRVVFLGLNPGPWGMAQTGVPFGEVAAVRDWLGIDAAVRRPAGEHPKRPVEGLSCARSEVSGRRLWGLFAERFGTPERFFADHFVANYCALMFVEDSGRNRTPDKLPAAERDALLPPCDEHLLAVVTVLQPTWLIGVGRFAFDQARRVVDAQVRVASILHPSPASPVANRGWAHHAAAQLRQLGVW